MLQVRTAVLLPPSGCDCQWRERFVVHLLNSLNRFISTSVNYLHFILKGGDYIGALAPYDDVMYLCLRHEGIVQDLKADISS